MKRLLKQISATRLPLPQLSAMALFPQAYLKAFYRSSRAGTAALTLSFDVDYQADVASLPELLDMLRPYPFKTSFAIVGRWVEQYPDQHLMILDEGHELINHSYSHPNSEELAPDRYFSQLSPAEQAE